MQHFAKFLCFVVFMQLYSCGRKEEGSLTSASKTRLDRAIHAEKVLMQTTFYRDGRGMIFPTGFATVEKTKLWRFIKPLLDQAGFVLQDDQLVGVFARPHKEAAVVALGCVACHAGKAAGRVYVGLGNKNIDVGQAGAMGKPLIALLKGLEPLVGVEGMRETIDNSQPFFELVSRPGVANLTQGLVPTAAIADWFFRVQGASIPAKYQTGSVKVPSWWGYGEKRHVGQFADGFGVGDPPGWGLAVELTAGQTPENIRAMIHDVEIAEQLIGDLLPPPYPYNIDQAKAEDGKKLFTKNCSRCHGSYERDDEGYPVYKSPRHIPIATVMTDPGRTMNIDDELREKIALSPLSDILIANGSDDLPPGYFAPRLHAVWARFPYLHNGSVPNIMSLLSTPENRPRVFSLRDAGEEYRFDKERIGLNLLMDGTKEDRNLKSAAKSAARWVYDTTRPESSSQGHLFGTDLSHTQKLSLMEYLKTL